MNFSQPFLLVTVFFRTALPCSGGYHLERGGMPLHDAGGINCKKGTITENKNRKKNVPTHTITVCVCVLSELT